MSAGDEIILPAASWRDYGALLGALGLGGLLTALVKRPSRRAVEAAAGRDVATGEAAVIASIASAFTGTTGALREEIERMQEMLDDMRRRVTEAEAQAATQARVITDQAGLIIDLKGQLEISNAERDEARGRVGQLEGDVRQLNAVIAAKDRVGQ